MEWWNREINERTAIAFLKECQSFTEKAIARTQPDIKARRFSHKIPNVAAPFMPFGAVIHTTRTKTIWDFMRVIGVEACASHFIISSHKGIKNNEFELLGAVPCNILMPMGWESAVLHSSFLSMTSWGIDLRNIGKVRPWRSPIGSEPTPVFFGEENANTFKYTNTGEPSFYWWDNLWRRKFEGAADKWFDFYYEVPSFSQIKTLIILLRVLNALHPLDRRAIVPASCVNRIDPVTPHVDWEIVRNFVFEDDDVNPKMENFGHRLVAAKAFDDFKPSSADEVAIMDNAKLHRWRTENDDGMLHFLMNGKSINFGDHRNTGKAQFHMDLNLLGYDTTDIDFAARMFAIGNKIHPDRLDDCVSVARKKIEKLQG